MFGFLAKALSRNSDPIISEPTRLPLGQEGA